MVLQLFEIGLKAILAEWANLRQKINLANAIFRKTFGVSLKAHCMRKDEANTYELILRECLVYIKGVISLKLPSGKVITPQTAAP
jgi:hypothetical protein